MLKKERGSLQVEHRKSLWSFELEVHLKGFKGYRLQKQIDRMDQMVYFLIFFLRFGEWQSSWFFEEHKRAEVGWPFLPFFVFSRDGSAIDHSKES